MNDITQYLYDLAKDKLPLSDQYAFVSVVQSAFMIRITKRNYKNMTYNDDYNRVVDYPFFDWLYENINEDDFDCVYMNGGVVVNVDIVWAGLLSGILFRYEEDAVMFKLMWGDKLGQ